MRLEVDVQYALDDEKGDAWLPEAEGIEAWAQAALGGRRDAAQFVLRIVGEQEGRELNEHYRARKGPTNVLSFPFEHPDLLDPPLLGDVVICAPVVEREAAEQGKTAQAHWAHLVIHGLLHLIGYDHEEENEAVIMESVERKVLAGLGFPDPYAGETAIAESLPGGGA
ncbi:MAG: rRNA maturation RNase YbeY [Gammaproteobacteria bacterium]|jgi:probable rRNA maturation factor|nr:rRNA maturation RNase YbeY [Gammaproteobacteria bacterium]